MNEISRGADIQQASTWNLCKDLFLLQILPLSLQGCNLPFCPLPVPGKCWNATIMCYQTMLLMIKICTKELLMMTIRYCTKENRSIMVTGLDG